MPERARNGRWARAGMVAAAVFAVAFAAIAQVNPLPPDRGFHFSARMLDARTVEARFSIADGYYL